MSRKDEELAVIDVNDLDDVTGGTATNDQITEALQGIQKTLDGMKSSSQNNTHWFLQLLPLFFSRGGFTIGSACGCGCGARGGCRGKCG